MLLRTGCSLESNGKKDIIWLNFATCAENIGANYPDAELYSTACGGGHQSECHISESPPPPLPYTVSPSPSLHIPPPDQICKLDTYSISKRERETRRGDRSFDLDMCACVWRLALPSPLLLRRRILYFPRGPFPSFLPQKGARIFGITPARPLAQSVPRSLGGIE